jgi:hypothetical protein
MRLTVNLDEDLYQIARTQAFADRVSISHAVNAILRRALDTGHPADPPSGRSPKSVEPRGRRGFPVSRGTRRITAEDVERIESAGQSRPANRAKPGSP